MKSNRFVSTLLLAATLVCVLATTAFADGYVYRSAGFLKFRTTDLFATLAARDPVNAVLDQNSANTSTAGHIDSVGYTPGAADNQDTTVVFLLPPDAFLPSPGDSLPAVMIVWRVQTSGSDKTPAAFASGDTTYAVLDPSPGGTVFTSQSITVATPAVVGTNGWGVTSVFKANPAGSAAGSQSNPENRLVVPAFGPTKTFRVRTYSDGSAATTGSYFVTGEVLYPVMK